MLLDTFSMSAEGDCCLLGEWEITVSFFCLMLQGKLEDKEDGGKVAGSKGLS